MMLGATNALWHHVQIEFVIHISAFSSYEMCIDAFKNEIKNKLPSPGLHMSYLVFKAFLTVCTLLPC